MINENNANIGRLSINEDAAKALNNASLNEIGTVLSTIITDTIGEAHLCGAKSCTISINPNPIKIEIALK